MSAESAILALCGIASPFVVGGFLMYRQKQSLLKIYSLQWIEYNKYAHVTTRYPYEQNSDYEVVVKMAREVVTSKGQLAVIVRCNRGLAIQHINVNGNFSKKGPYFISRGSGNWNLTGRNHIIKVLSSKWLANIKSSNPYQDEGILETGLSIVEFDTKEYFKLDIYDFVKLIEKKSPNESLHWTAK